jgi:hypothetical protein
MAYINYLLLDAALMGEQLHQAKALNPTFISLLSNDYQFENELVAPYIFKFEPHSPFARWYMENGWGKGWGVMARSYASLEELRVHFRKFILVLNDDDQEIYFRFYNPRVLTIFLPTFTAYQLKDFFGPVDYFMIEEESGTDAQIIWMEGMNLYSNRIGKKEVEQRFRAEIYTQDPRSKKTSFIHEENTRSNASDQQKEKPRMSLVNYINTGDNKPQIIEPVSKKEKRNRFFFEE